MNPINLSLTTFTVIFLALIADMARDFGEYDLLSLHILLEGGVAILAGGMILILYKALREQQEDYKALEVDLTKAKTTLAQTQKQSEKLMGDLSKIIQQQFDDWTLTKSEREVALLLLKGLTLDEIAGVRDTKPKTIRQQASNVYKKANLSGRHELVAYFLEDLLK
jgi:DNA-binding CsgD family transcriptional regulator